MGATHYHEAVRSSSPPEAPLVIPPGILASGRARAALPLRREGPEKLTGLAKYADDLVFPGAWYGATIRSTEPHARLLGIDLDPEYDWSKVVVVTAADIPGDNVVSLIQDDQPVLVAVGAEIQHQAEPVCLLAAPDRAILRAAKHHVTPAHRAPAGRLRPAPVGPRVRALRAGQGRRRSRAGRGRPRGRGEYRVGHQEQLYIENQAMIAVPRPDGGVKVHGSMQCPYYIHGALKRALNLTDAQAVVIQAETGGGFGGKEEYPSMIALHAALLAAACRQAGPHDLRPPRGHQRHHQAPPGRGSGTGPA